MEGVHRLVLDKLILEKIIEEYCVKDNNILVSIIVPIYGAEIYLPACIESICNQTYKNIQIILVDDQSPDNCPKICDDYAKKDFRIKVIHQKNKGVSGARNTGLCNASGDYIMFVDSDDELRSDAVSVLLKDSLTFGADIVVSPLKTIETQSCAATEPKDDICDVYINDEALLYHLQSFCKLYSVCGALFKKKFIESIYFEEGKNINEDGFFMFQCCLKKPLLVYHNTYIYKYKRREDSCSRQRFSEKFLSMLYFCDKKKKLLSHYYPQYINEYKNIEMFTILQFLDIFCSSNEKKYYKDLEKKCINRVRELYTGHKSYNKHYMRLAWIVKYGLFPIYKMLIKLKYCK